DQRMCVDEKERMNLNLCHKVDDKWKLSDTIKEETRNKQYPQISPEFWNFEHEIVLSPYEASLKEKELVCLEKAPGRICAQSGYIYPPGIPFIMPVERLERKDMERVLYYQTHGFRSEERRVGKECRTCERTKWTEKKNNTLSQGNTV